MIGIDLTIAAVCLGAFIGLGFMLTLLWQAVLNTGTSHDEA